jgi:hypothetical protein
LALLVAAAGDSLMLAGQALLRPDRPVGMSSLTLLAAAALLVLYHLTLRRTAVMEPQVRLERQKRLVRVAEGEAPTLRVVRRVTALNAQAMVQRAAYRAEAEEEEAPLTSRQEHLIILAAVLRAVAVSAG